MATGKFKITTGEDYMFFKCKHPHASLAVEKEHTIDKIDDDFEGIDYHLFCTACGENLKI